MFLKKQKQISISKEEITPRNKLLDSFDSPKKYCCQGLSNKAEDSLTLASVQQCALIYNRDCNVFGTISFFVSHPNSDEFKYLRALFNKSKTGTSLKTVFIFAGKQVLQREVDSTELGAQQLCNSITLDIGSKHSTRSWGTGNEGVVKAEKLVQFMFNLLEKEKSSSLVGTDQQHLEMYEIAYQEVKERKVLVSRWSSKETLVEEVTSSIGHYPKKYIALLIADHIMFSSTEVPKEKKMTEAPKEKKRKKKK
jgi:hypothetical protein